MIEIRMFEHSELRISLSTSCAGAERAFVLTQASGKDAIQISSFCKAAYRKRLFHGRLWAQRVKYKPAKMTPAPKAWTTPKASPKKAYPATTAKTGAKLLYREAVVLPTLPVAHTQRPLARLSGKTPE